MTLGDWVTLYLSIAALVAMWVLSDDVFDTAGAAGAGLAWPLYVLVAVALVAALGCALVAGVATWLGSVVVRWGRR